MGGGLAFLTKKSFNPANWSNQRQVWEARQKNETEKRRIVERDAQIKREREEEDLARVVGGEEEGGRKALGFMYEAGKIPGLGRKNNNEGEEEEDDGGGKISATVQGSGGGGGGGEDTSIYERQAGDDDAAAAFRALLARGVADDSTTNAQNSADEAAAQQALGTNPNGNGEDEEEKKAPDHRTALEKAVGRGINAGSSVTLAQQMERFPMLKGAPMVLQKPDGAGGKDGEKEENAAANVAGLNFKPLGHMLRNVQCMVCKQWGHSRGDRECQVSGWNPFASVSAMPTVVAPVVAAAKPDPTPPAVAKDAEKVMHDERKNKSDHKRHKKEKRRRKEDRHRKKKRKKYHKRSSRRRSPSYSSSDSDSDSSFDSYDDKRPHRRNNGRRSRHDSDESGDEGRRQHSRKEMRREKSSSRRYREEDGGRSRSRSRSASKQDMNTNP